MLIEKTKIYDKMYIDTGIKIHWMHEAANKYNFAEESEIVEWKQACVMQGKIKQDQMISDNQLSTWFKENAKKYVDELGECEDFGKNIKINFEYFFNLFDVLEFFINIESSTIRNEVKAERRAILATGDMTKYQ